MPRPRAFDERSVVDAATRVFWDRGFEATSTEDLCTATGLSRSSLYNAFTDKRSLYETALHGYLQQRTSDLLAVLDGDGTARDRIGAVVAQAANPDPDDPAGCFVVNATVELASENADSALGRTLRHDRRRRLDALARVLDEGRRDGSIRSPRPSAELAEFVVATISGLRVAACGGADAATLRVIAATALDAL